VVAQDAPAALRARTTAAVRVRIELDTNCPAALAALTGLAGVEELGGHPAASGAGMVIEYTTSEPHRVNPVVVARLVDTGARVVTVTAAAPPLEEVYAQVVADPAVRKTLPGTIRSDGR
jgi:hypothetical protein